MDGFVSLSWLSRIVNQHPEGVDQVDRCLDSLFER
jgi:hypothetical protein